MLHLTSTPSPTITSSLTSFLCEIESALPNELLAIENSAISADLPSAQAVAAASPSSPRHTFENIYKLDAGLFAPLSASNFDCPESPFPTSEILEAAWADLPEFSLELLCVGNSSIPDDMESTHIELVALPTDLTNEESPSQSHQSPEIQRESDDSPLAASPNDGLNFPENTPQTANILITALQEALPELHIVPESADLIHQKHHAAPSAPEKPFIDQYKELARLIPPSEQHHLESLTYRSHVVKAYILGHAAGLPSVGNFSSFLKASRINVKKNLNYIGRCFSSKAKRVSPLGESLLSRIDLGTRLAYGLNHGGAPLCCNIAAEQSYANSDEGKWNILALDARHMLLNRHGKKIGNVSIPPRDASAKVLENYTSHYDQSPTPSPVFDNPGAVTSMTGPHLSKGRYPPSSLLISLGSGEAQARERTHIGEGTRPTFPPPLPEKNLLERYKNINELMRPDDRRHRDTLSYRQHVTKVFILDRVAKVPLLKSIPDFLKSYRINTANAQNYLKRRFSTNDNRLLAPSKRLLLRSDLGTRIEYGAGPSQITLGLYDIPAERGYVRSHEGRWNIASIDERYKLLNEYDKKIYKMVIPPRYPSAVALENSTGKASG